MNALVKPFTGLLGLVLTIAGIAGFFTSGMLLMFEVDTVHNVFHLVSGLVGLFAFGSSQLYARWYLILLGLVYGFVAAVGFATGGFFDLMAISMANNYLYLGIAVVGLILGFGSRK
ncbi:MAG: DUF4383 domain-containing protein [Candidatus Peribacteraceae bacterium]|nr:DUF4383 domain-containing protein [Candidatus Peribacteraceae bacterium]MBP9850306.1 DUF4383 domain-containing protein [Candidatus Peribacteraceae bacterium]